jgi:hypothetical protein
MSFAKRVQRWWDSLLGRPPWYRDPDPVTTRSALQAQSPGRKKTTAPGELTLADDAPENGPRKRRSAGMDPYSNDAGFSKPHSWERLDHD